MTGPDDSLAAWSDALAAATATPAGGSAAAIGGALAAALVEMVASLTKARESYAGARTEVAAAADQAASLRRRLMELATEDATAFQDVMTALALPRGTEAEIAYRNSARADALKGAASVQYELMLLAGQTAELAEALIERGLRSAVGDAAAAVFLAAAACRSGYWAIRSNLRRIYEDSEADRLAAAAIERFEQVEALERRVELRLGERV
jgi:formiminotetrahydrofolate cyclodeaminase